MEQFWEQSGPTVTEQHSSYQPPAHHYEDNDQFDFTGATTQNNYQSYQNQQLNHYQSTPYTSSINNNTMEQDQVTKALREQEQRIQENLRQKANDEYELKRKRKQHGRQQLEEFLHNKQQQTIQRKQQNLKKQQRLYHDIKSSQSSVGWQKVSQNIGLKQGQYKGNKDINRMRQAILHKRQDQSTQK